MHLFPMNKSASFLPSRTIRIKLTTADYCVARNTQMIHKTNERFVLHKNSYTSLHLIALIVQSIELIPTKVLASLPRRRFQGSSYQELPQKRLRGRLSLGQLGYYNSRQLLLQFTTIAIIIYDRYYNSQQNMVSFVDIDPQFSLRPFFSIFQDINIKVQYRSTFSLKEKH